MSVRGSRLSLVGVVCVLGLGLGWLSVPTEALAAAPLIEGESVLNVSGDSATLQAQVNPEGAGTTYRFEYDTSAYDSPAAHGQSSPSPEGSAGEGSAPVTVETHVQGLTPATVYHFRVVIDSVGGEERGVNSEFKTESVGGQLVLPDDRAWELVSPPDKQGSTITPIPPKGGLIQASENGERIAYLASAPVEADSNGNPAPNYTSVLSTRHLGEGWTSEDIATLNNSPTGVLLGTPSEYDFFSSDDSLGLLGTIGETPLVPLGEVGENTKVYLREANGGYVPLVTRADVTSGSKCGCQVGFVGATSDLSHVVLESEVPLTSGKEVESEGVGIGGLYEWAGGGLQPVSVLPDGEAAGDGPELGEKNQDARGAISEDGSRVVWSEHVGGDHLFVRDMRRKETVQLDALETGQSGCSEQCPATFQIASGNDSRVFFTDESDLTADSTAVLGFGPRQGSPDLYMFEVAGGGGSLGGRLTDLTVDHEQPADVRGMVLGAGENTAKEITSVYFVATGVLAGNENNNKEKAVAGEDNLYVSQLTGQGWASTFIADLSSEDGKDWVSENGDSKLNEMTSRVSPDGEYLAFMSDRSLTGYDNTDVNSGAADEEVFLYRASTHGLVCASCDPTGARPTGVLEPEDEAVDQFKTLLVDKPGNWQSRWLAGSVPGWTAYRGGTARYQSRYLSDSGRLFFTSPDTLVPQATDGLENVYEYEPEGVGSCGSSDATFGSDSGGCVGLISSGSSASESAFLDASETGNDVFFLTSAKLASQDYDGAYDVYDAHVCSGGSPCPSVAVVSPPPCTTADSCKAAPTPQPAIFGAPASSTFSGAGNATPTVSKPVVKAKKPKSKAKHKKAKKSRKKVKRSRKTKKSLSTRSGR
jgi:hypothetical protein